jgi:hypothetical protein
MIQLTNPTWLWGLIGLFIPIGIHLLSRKEGRTIYIGSIRHLRESDSAQFSSIRLNEILLLLIRCLLLTLVTLFLAGFKITTINDENKKWLVVEPGIQNDESLKPLFDSLHKQQYELHYLTGNFPASINSNTKPPLDYWALVEDLKSKSIKNIIVITYNYATRFKGKRISASENIHWILREPTSEEFLADAVVTPKDSVSVRFGFSTSVRTKFETKSVHKPDLTQLPSVDSIIRKQDSIHVTIFNDAEFNYDRKVVVASLRAIQSIAPDRIVFTSKSIEQFNSAITGWIVWLSKKKPAFARGTNSIGYAPCQGEADGLIEPAQKAQFHCADRKSFKWVITKHLNEELAIKENFTLALASIILHNENDTLRAHDKRVLPEQLSWASAEDILSATTSFSPNDAWNKYLVILMLLMLTGERWLAHHRNQ